MRPDPIGLNPLRLLGIISLTVSYCATAASNQSEADTLRVAVAANFRPAAEALAEIYTARTGTELLISSASTGVLATQWRRGAPFDLLLAADEARPAMLVDKGLTLGDARCYAEGSLVLLGSDDLEPALSAVDLSIAIANPRSAPYGLAAETVLRRDGFADPDSRRVVNGSNVQQAFQFWDSGAADLALVARSLDPGNGLPIPRDWHDPIRQYAVISAASERAARAEEFLNFVTGDRGRELLAAFGYEDCE